VEAVYNYLTKTAGAQISYIGLAICFFAICITLITSLIFDKQKRSREEVTLLILFCASTFSTCVGFCIAGGLNGDVPKLDRATWLPLNRLAWFFAFVFLIIPTLNGTIKVFGKALFNKEL